MSEFFHKGKLYQNPVEFTLDKLGGKWKIPILWNLKESKKRYGELKSSLRNITHKMLASQLKELEKDGFIHREVFAFIPPKTEYSLTKKGKKTIPLIQFLRKYGIELMKEEGIDVSKFKKNENNKKYKNT